MGTRKHTIAWGHGPLARRLVLRYHSRVGLQGRPACFYLALPVLSNHGRHPGVCIPVINVDEIQSPLMLLILLMVLQMLKCMQSPPFTGRVTEGYPGGTTYHKLQRGNHTSPTRAARSDYKRHVGQWIVRAAGAQQVPRWASS